MKLRNRAIHQTEALTKETQEEIEKGVLFMRVMEFYLANVGSIRPQDGRPSGTGEVMDAGARAGEGSGSGETSVDTAAG